MDKLEFNNENPRLGIKETSPSKKLNIGGQQTAVEWLWRWINDNQEATIKQGNQAFEQAKEIEKLQVINAFKTGEYNSVDYFNAEYPHQECSENYYNETYNK